MKFLVYGLFAVVSRNFANVPFHATRYPNIPQLTFSLFYKVPVIILWELVKSARRKCAEKMIKSGTKLGRKMMGGK